MNKLLKYILLVLSFVILWSCSADDKELTRETKVLNDIFKQLTDSMLFFKVYPPPPPPTFSSSSLLCKNKEELLLYDKWRKEYNHLISLMDTTQHILSMNDSLKFDDDDFTLAIPYLKKDRSNLSYNEAFDSYVKKRKKEQPIDISKITNTGKYKLVICKDRHEIRDNKKYPKYKYSYYGILTLSRIYFNSSYDRGFLVCSILGETDNYNCQLIFIKKDKMGWRIEKMKLLAIS